MEIKINDSYSRSFQITSQIIEGFAKVTGDNNPVHLNEDYAGKTIFKARIAHGFLIGSFISAVLGNDFPGNGTIYVSQSMKFLKPVYIGDTIRVKLEVINITEKNWLVLKTECVNQSEKTVITGEAVVVPPAHVNVIQ